MLHKQSNLARDTFAVADVIANKSIAGLLMLLPYVFAFAFFFCLVAVAIRYFAFIGLSVDIPQSASYTAELFRKMSGN